MKFFISCFSIFAFLSFTSFNPERGEIIDSFNGVNVYFNGHTFTTVSGRSTTMDGYNLGLKYQCVEFVKRYYYQVYGHKMPNSFGHAREYFDKRLGDKERNKARGLMQYRNVREFAPKQGDLLVYDSCPGNPFGHVAIITKVSEDHVEIIQQNTGKESRASLKLVKFMDYYTIADYNILGWLRYE